MYNFLFEITDLNSDYCGEMFFVQENKVYSYEYAYTEAWNVAMQVADDAVIKCLGNFSDIQAEMMGYDTY